MATKNVSDNGTEKVELSAIAAGMDSAEAFEAWLNEPANYATRVVKGEKQQYRRPCSLSCNVPADIYYQAVHDAMGDKARLDNGDMTDFVRSAVWVKLGYTEEEYTEWAIAEEERIKAALSERISGVGAERAAKVKAMETENQTLKSELDQLKAMLAEMQAKS